MQYQSTRGNGGAVSSAEAIKRGLAPDGGLYLPKTVPPLTKDDLSALLPMSYAKRAARVLSLFLTDYDAAALREDCEDAYREDRFPGGAAPLTHFGSLSMLELWHGPTSAFKDMALQLMPRLLVRALRTTGEDRTAHILVATSGDTGKAALEGYRDVDGVKITVFYPCDGVSPMQKRQMVTQEGKNVAVWAVRGNFDDAQTGVKRIFSDPALVERANRAHTFFSSANSINWGRLVPQIVYYVSAYCDLVSAGRIVLGDAVNVCVPTGNFGNLFAAYLAREMGLPFRRLICASNANHVLTDFLRTGIYDRTRPFHQTMSPSMDILISSNLERLLGTVGGAELTARLMRSLGETGSYTVPDSVMDRVRAVFSGYFLTEEETAGTIRTVFRENGALIDPHTAVGWGAAEKYRAATGDDTPLILASTASPYKFAADVCRALDLPLPDVEDPAARMHLLSAETGTEIPSPLSRTLSLPVRFTGVIDPAEMAEVLF